MGGCQAEDRRMMDEDSKEAYAAYKEMMDRWLDACLILEKRDKPQWQKTVDAMLCFKKLNITHLPTRWRKRLDRAFLQINRISAQYPIETWDDYQKISADDLTRIGQLIQNMPGRRPPVG
jgi:hypothetical protein